jgi:GNAT superfamily N-acetyltransferase
MEDDKGDFENELKSAFGNDHMLVAMESEEIVGFLRSQIRENKEGKKVDKVIMLLVSPEKYGEGIGGELIERERKWAKDEGVDVLDIEVR